MLKLPCIQKKSFRFNFPHSYLPIAPNLGTILKFASVAEKTDLKFSDAVFASRNFLQAFKL